MITPSNNISALNLSSTAEPRTAGTMPVWNNKPTNATNSAIEQIQRNLSQASITSSSKAAATNSSFAHSLIAIEELPSPPQDIKTQQAQPPTEEEFGFYDLLDMINPLQHIPLISNIYREVTSDEIKPFSRIIGGAIFGGGLGAAGALANVIIEVETGGDIAQNAFAMLRGEKINQPTTTTHEDLPGALLSFVDLSHTDNSTPTIALVSEQPEPATAQRRYAHANNDRYNS